MSISNIVPQINKVIEKYGTICTITKASGSTIRAKSVTSLVDNDGEQFPGVTPTTSKTRVFYFAVTRQPPEVGDIIDFDGVIWRISSVKDYKLGKTKIAYECGVDG